MACHIYDNKHCKVLTIACCDMQSKDAQAQTLSGRILTMSCSRIMSSRWTSRTLWRTVQMQIGMWWWRFIVGIGDQTVPLEAQECTWLFHWFANVDKILQKVAKWWVFGERTWVGIIEVESYNSHWWFQAPRKCYEVLHRGRGSEY